MIGRVLSSGTRACYRRILGGQTSLFALTLECMVSALPSGSESARPFLPARDFETSKAFYEALGFDKELDDDEVAIYRVGGSGQRTS
jgi:hypothetical protein